ncbi:MAG: hypothetical protein QNJ94_14525 [Alphaproteobacteria bacterium]|nr:hypothetical protein [Alphaproteobacteria bacterium]
MVEFTVSDRIELEKMFQNVDDIREHYKSLIPAYRLFLKASSRPDPEPVRREQLGALTATEKEQLEEISDGLYIIRRPPDEVEVVNKLSRRLSRWDRDLTRLIKAAKSQRLIIIDVQRAVYLIALKIVKEEPATRE